MKCPVCKIEIKFDVQALDEVYYDCSHCSSSLLFKNGECEVLNEGITQEAVSNKPDSSKKGIAEKKLEPEIDSKGSFQEEISVKNEERNESGLEISQEEHQSIPSADKEEKSDNKPKGEGDNVSSLSGEDAVKETFFPDETTQVPELSEKELSEAEADTSKEKPQDSSVAIAKTTEQSSNEVSSEKDFVFGEELKESSSELQNKDLDKEADSQKKEDFSDVAEFGNTEDENRKGLLLYNLQLSEINSQTLKEKVLATLQDEFLNLSFSEEDIREGRMDILKISPVQAYIIVTALMGLPLQISWSQHHIADD